MKQAYEVTSYIVTADRSGQRQSRPVHEMTEQDQQGLLESWSRNLRDNGYEIISERRQKKWSRTA